MKYQTESEPKPSDFLKCVDPITLSAPRRPKSDNPITRSTFRRPKRDTPITLSISCRPPKKDPITFGTPGVQNYNLLSRSTALCPFCDAKTHDDPIKLLAPLVSRSSALRTCVQTNDGSFFRHPWCPDPVCCAQSREGTLIDDLVVKQYRSLTP